MAKKAKKSKRGRQQDRARVAGRQDYEVGYAAKKAGKSRGAIRKAVVGGTKRAAIRTADARRDQATCRSS